MACDFSLGMLQAGQARQVKNDPFQAKTRGRVAFAAGDALRLPFKDGAFDAVTISFGLRNVHGTTGSAGGDAPGDPSGRATCGVRVQ